MRRLRDIVLVTLAAGLLACGASGGTTPDMNLDALERGDVLLQVDNDNNRAVTLYGVSSGDKFRIGQVRALDQRAFWVRSGRYEGQGRVNYLLQPTGTRGDRVYGLYDRFPWGAYRYLMPGDPSVGEHSVVSIRLMPELGHSHIQRVGGGG